LLLIPAYNEENRIEPVLREYAGYFKDNYRGNFQLVVVLNGCRDNTLGVVQKVAADYPSIRIDEFPNRIGKGGALIEGLKLAPLGDLIGYVDADGATPPKAFHDLVKQMGDADCVIGSRWLPGAVLHVQQTNRRQFASRTFHRIVEFFFHLNIKDTQCGAKLLRRQAVEKVHSNLFITDMAFDINLLYVLKRAGYKTREVPTEWTDKIGSKVNLGRTSLMMFLSVVRLRVIYSPLGPIAYPLRPLAGWVFKLLRAPELMKSPKSTDKQPQSKQQSSEPPK
jgi:glycosyltransferase involved in cell wall biosynthesis